MKLGIVTPWFGPHLTGGAERVAYEVALGMSARGHAVSVLTTCAASFHAPWDRDAYAEGESEGDGFRLLRFAVDRANTQRFKAVNRKLLAIPAEYRRPGAPGALDDGELHTFLYDNINSTSLLAFLACNDNRYDAIVFLPYLYGTTLRGWRIVADRAAIVPCLHDESYAYLPPVSAMMRGAGRLLFNSSGEFELARRLFGPGIVPRSRLVGCGVTTPPARDGPGEPLRKIVPERERYLLYLGRRSIEKNLETLLEGFAQFKRLHPQSTLRLVMAGPGQREDHSAGGGVLDLGFVSDEQKARLLRCARALVQPSANESFSRAIVEAWACGRPVVVNRQCAATADALRATGAGWAAGQPFEWADVFQQIDEASDLALAERGSQAAEFVRRHGSWASALDRYEAELEGWIAERSRPLRKDIPPVVQVLERADFADAPTALALNLDAALRRARCRSSVVARQVDPRLRGRVGSFAPGTVNADGVSVIFGSGVPSAMTARRPIFVHLDATAAAEAQPSSGVALAASATVLRILTSRSIDAAPFRPTVDHDAWNVEPDATLMAGLLDGQTNIVCIGAIRPDGRQLEILETFGCYLTLDYRARIIFTGRVADLAYADALRERIERYAIEHRVMLTGEVSQPTLAAIFRSAHLVVTFREHDRTGLGMLEAMLFDVPVCAAASVDANAVLGTGGLLLDDIGQPLRGAALWRLLVHEHGLRERIVASQRQRLAELADEDGATLVTRSIAQPS